MNGTHDVAVTSGESTITPEHKDKQVGGTPLLAQHEP